MNLASTTGKLENVNQREENSNHAFQRQIRKRPTHSCKWTKRKLVKHDQIPRSHA